VTAAEQAVELWLVGMTPEVLALVRRSALATALGEERIFFDLEDAVAKYQQTRAGIGAPKSG
jgi:hypothetical protein